MGCFQSIPKKTRGVELIGEPIRDKLDLPSDDHAVHEFFEVQNEPIVESEAIQGNPASVDENFFDPELMSDFDSSICSPGRDLVSSGIVELPESMGDSSSHCSHRPTSPEFVVSPNPGSPDRTSPLPRQIPPVVAVAVVKPPESPVRPDEFKSATATPIQTSVIPVVVPLRAPSRPSRILEVAEAKNKVLMLHVFGVWRFESFSSKVDSFRSKLEAAGKASALILKDNAALKARVAELEHAIAVVQAVPMKTMCTTTDDLEGFTSVPSTPPVKSHVLSGFATPVSNPASAKAADYATPPASIVKLSWEDYLRPSLKEQAPPVLAAAAPVPEDRKGKLRAISEDLTRLSESLSAVELKHRRPLNDSNK